MNEFKKILVPTDYSDLSVTALDYAVSLAGIFGSRIYLMHTLDTIPVLALQNMDLTTEAVISDTERNARNDLHMFVISTIGNIPNLVEVVRKGIAEEEIVRFAKEEDIDLIIMATHGRSGLSHVLMGSVAEKVVQQSPAPVLIVNPAKMKRQLSEKSAVSGHPELA